MKKLLIIRSNKESSWGSCKVISPNLQEAYKRLEGPECHILFFDIDENFIKDDAIKDGTNIIDLAETIKNYRPSEIVFTDHQPHATEILSFLSFYITWNEMPDLVIHVYGDFTFFAHRWSHMSENLKGKKVKFIVASESQAKLVKSFCNDSACVEQFIFPVDESEYFFDYDERIRFRRENYVKDYEIVFLYSGRISLQKNVETLIDEYAAICEVSVFPTKLWIVGAFDDHGAPFQGILHNEGFMYAKIQEALRKYSPKVLHSIKFWGHQPKKILRELKNASDLFMSFSLYHDEDYGMSPAEALACGLPTLLTDWGGYSSFVSNKWFCELVPIELSQYGHKLELEKVTSFFNEYSLSYINYRDRHRWSNAFLSEFSISSSLGRLKSILWKDYSDFAGFNWNLEHFAQVYWSVKHGRELNLQLMASLDNVYSHVYKNYISGKRT